MLFPRELCSAHRDANLLRVPVEKVAPLDAANSQRYWLGATHNVRVSISGKEGQEKLLVIFSLWEERDMDLIIVSSLLWYNAR